DPPPRPRIPGNGPPIESLPIPEHLDADTVRSVFRALNTQGRLDSLRPFFEEAPSRVIDELIEVADHQVFQTALDPQGLIGRLDAHVHARHFSEFQKKTSELAADPEFSTWKRAAFFALDQPLAPVWLGRAAPFLEADWMAIVRVASDLASDEGPLFPDDSA